MIWKGFKPFDRKSLDRTLKTIYFQFVGSNPTTAVASFPLVCRSPVTSSARAATFSFEDVRLTQFFSSFFSVAFRLSNFRASKIAYTITPTTRTSIRSLRNIILTTDDDH